MKKIQMMNMLVDDEEVCFKQQVLPYLFFMMKIKNEVRTGT